MTALHLLHRRLDPRLPVQSVSGEWFWTEWTPSSPAATRSRVAVMESLPLGWYAVLQRCLPSIAQKPCARPRARWCMPTPVIKKFRRCSSTESQQAFCAGAKPGIEQPLRRAKLEDAPEVRRLLTPTGYDCFPLGIACTAYLETQAYFHKPQGHPPQFWYCETCKMGMIHSCPVVSTAPCPSGGCYDQGSLGLGSSALAPKECKPAPKPSEEESCTLLKLSSSSLLSWMAACCLIGASALAF